MSIERNTRWPIWPLPARNGQRPVLLVEDDDNPYVDIAYARTPDVESALVHSTSLCGLAPFHLPAKTPVFAIEDGLVAYAGWHGDGYRVVIEHAHKWLSYYGNLDRLIVQPQANVRETVKCGDIIGYAGDDLETRPLRFEVWVLDYDFGYLPLDPIRFMHHWKRLPLPGAAANDQMPVMKNTG